MLLVLDIEYASDGRTSVRKTRGNGSSILSSTGAAVASNYVMESGIHYAEFQITAGICLIGIVLPMPNLDPRRYVNGHFSFTRRQLHDDFMAARSEDWGVDNVLAYNVHACEYDCEDGGVISTDWGGGHAEWDEWEGMEKCNPGNTVGMMLDLDEGKLSVYKNNRRLGVMKDELSGSYCWFARIFESSAVSIKRGKTPMT